MSDYRARLESKMEKGEEREETSLPPSPYGPIGSGAPAGPTGHRQEGRDGPQFFAAFAATMGNLVMGTCIGCSSPTGPLLAKTAQ